jgi:F-type H+-transporting ATPase subunit delta
MSTRKLFSTETSERYARALFEVASESFELENIENSLNELLVIYDSSSEFISFIKNPTYSNKDQLKAIDIISEKLNFTKNLKKFLLLLVEKRRIFFVKKIIKSFLKLCSEQRGEIKASLVSCKKLSEKELNEISVQFSQSMGSKVKFDLSVDESLIGGVKIQLGSLMVDTSIKNKLKQYEQLMVEK